MAIVALVIGLVIGAAGAEANDTYVQQLVGSAQAAGTTLLGKHTYQLNPANRREAVKDALLDEIEGIEVNQRLTSSRPGYSQQVLLSNDEQMSVIYETFQKHNLMTLGK